jgi:D-arabinose 1-dehydrogenase-like Zn-dependent alcohol dehydrogenase
VKTHTQTFSFDQANEALVALKDDAIKGAGVIVID